LLFLDDEERGGRMEEGVRISKHRFRLMSLIFRHPVSHSKYSKYSSNLQNHRRIQSRIFESSNPVESASNLRFFNIEILTGNMTDVHYTNQPLTAAGPETTEVGSIPDNATTAYHEYRIDWIPGATLFYLDGKLQKNLRRMSHRFQAAGCGITGSMEPRIGRVDHLCQIIFWIFSRLIWLSIRQMHPDPLIEYPR